METTYKDYIKSETSFAEISCQPRGHSQESCLKCLQNMFMNIKAGFWVVHVFCKQGIPYEQRKKLGKPNPCKTKLKILKLDNEKPTKQATKSL